MSRKKPPFDVVVVGTIYQDYRIRGEFFPDSGQTVIADEFSSSPGGGGANQAVAAARLGAKTSLVGKVGSDAEAEDIVQRLEQAGVDLEFLSRDLEPPTGKELVFVNHSGERRSMVLPGANEWLEPDEIMRAAPILTEAKAILVQMGIPLHCVLNAIRLGAGGRGKVILDASPSSALPDEFMSWIDIIRADYQETRRLSERLARGREAARLAAERLLWRGVKAAVAEAEGGENLLAWNDHELWLPSYDLQAVDCDGASDAFLAALAVAVAEDRPLPEAGTFANAAAALASSAFGTQAALPTRQEVLCLLQEDDIQLQRKRRAA